MPSDTPTSHPQSLWDLALQRPHPRAPLRDRHELLDRLAKRYGVRLSHFQSDFLPTGWQSRVKSHGRFGQIEVFLVEEYDIMLGKLFSNREKDRDDLRVLVTQLDKATLVSRLQTAGAALASEARLGKYTEGKWYILFGEPLPR